MNHLDSPFGNGQAEKPKLSCMILALKVLQLSHNMLCGLCFREMNVGELYLGNGAGTRSITVTAERGEESHQVPPVEIN